MLDFDRLDACRSASAEAYANAKPFHLLVIDDFAQPERLADLVAELPDPEDARINKSRDAVFAKNKFEKSGFETLGPACAEMHADLMSDRFAQWLRDVTGHEGLFIDPDFFGGGLHQGGRDSFLDMHVDFNLHPLHEDWARDLNILLYLNEGWDPSWAGELKLRHKDTGETREVQPLYNRCVIMETRGYTLHGYDKIHFPEGRYRRSIASYAYTPVVDEVQPRVTVWYPESGNFVKRFVGKSWPSIVRVKHKFLGSATAKNR